MRIRVSWVDDDDRMMDVGVGSITTANVLIDKLQLAPENFFVSEQMDSSGDYWRIIPNAERLARGA